MATRKRQTKRHEWERQAGESEKAFAAFQTYCSLHKEGKQSHREVVARHGRSLSTVKRWSARWQWVARYLARERHERTEVANALPQIKDFNVERQAAAWHRQSRDARQIQQLARAALTLLLKLDPQTGQPRLARSLTGAEIVALHRCGVTLESRVLADVRFDLDLVDLDSQDPGDAIMTPDQVEAVVWRAQRWKEQQTKGSRRRKR